MVAPAGIEPATHGASVRCSTDWATEPWRSRRELNPRSLPWQGSVLNHFTTGPWLRRLDLNQWPSGYEPDELPAALFRDIMAGNEGFEPPRAVKPLVVFKTTPFSLLGNCPWWTQQDSNLWPTGYEPVALTNWAMGPYQTLLSCTYGSTEESRTLDLPGMNRTL